MGLSKLNVWVSDVADPCGTWAGAGTITILDCKGVLEWPCGRYLAPDGKWLSVPAGKYLNLPFRCGHLEVELPPGCYWAIAGNVSFPPGHIHLNYTTHVGIVEVCCNENACVKLYNPTLRICWDWFRIGLRAGALAKGPGALDAGAVADIETRVEQLLRDVPRAPAEAVVERHFDALIASAGSESRG